MQANMFSAMKQSNKAYIEKQLVMFKAKFNKLFANVFNTPDFMCLDRGNHNE